MTYPSEMNFSQRQKVGAIALVVVLAILIAKCSPDGRDMSAPSPDQDQSIAIPTTIGPIETSPSSGFALTGLWVEGKAISAKYTCKGDSISPPILFTGVPAGTVTLGLVLADQDANGVIHWAVANIQAADTSMIEGVLPSGAIQAMTAQGRIGYWAPCPPTGQAHRYVMTAYAVPQQLELADGVDATTLQAALEAAALDIAESEFIAETP